MMSVSQGPPIYAKQSKRNRKAEQKISEVLTSQILIKIERELKNLEGYKMNY